MQIFRKDAERYITQCFEELVNNPDLESYNSSFVTELRETADLEKKLKANLFDKLNAKGLEELITRFNKMNLCTVETLRVSGKKASIGYEVIDKNEISEDAKQYLETLNKDSIEKITSKLPVEKVDRITSVPKMYINYLNDDNLIKILESDKYEEVIDSFKNIKKKKHINRIVGETEDINDLPEILNEPIPEMVVDKIPAKYEARFKAGFARKTDKEKDDIIEAIEDLYNNHGGKAKTMQDHHWIEQSRIKDKRRYPFLQHPPMRRNLLKDDSNLSLIVGHNGGHLNKYNEELDRALAEVLDNIKNNFGEDYMIFANNDNFKNFLEGEINKVINRMKMNYSKISVNNVFVID